jgi:putative glutathione S-transferase
MRFDAVYVGHFKCNIRRIADYPHLSKYLKTLYDWPGVAATVHIDHIKTHYYWSHITINPTRIVPVGPVLDFVG